MRRWTARFVLLLMLVPAIGPLALAYVAPANGMHCMRRPLAAASQAAAGAASETAMHCHHGAVQTPAVTADSEASIYSRDCCCHYGGCCCCRGLTSSEWAQPAANHFSFLHERIGVALVPAVNVRVAAFIGGPDSARAPPRS